MNQACTCISRRWYWANTYTDTKILGLEVHVFNRCFALYLNKYWKECQMYHRDGCIGLCIQYCIRPNASQICICKCIHLSIQECIRSNVLALYSHNVLKAIQFGVDRIMTSVSGIVFWCCITFCICYVLSWDFPDVYFVCIHACICACIRHLVCRLVLRLVLEMSPCVCIGRLYRGVHRLVSWQCIELDGFCVCIAFVSVHVFRDVLHEYT